MRSIEKIIGCLHENLIKFRLKTFPAFLNNSFLSKAFNIIRIHTTVKHFLLLMFISVFVRLLVCMLVNQTNKKQWKIFFVITSDSYIGCFSEQLEVFQTLELFLNYAKRVVEKFIAKSWPLFLVLSLPWKIFSKFLHSLNFYKNFRT